MHRTLPSPTTPRNRPADCMQPVPCTRPPSDTISIALLPRGVPGRAAPGRSISAPSAGSALTGRRSDPACYAALVNGKLPGHLIELLEQAAVALQGLPQFFGIRRFASRPGREQRVLALSDRRHQSADGALDLPRGELHRGTGVIDETSLDLAPLLGGASRGAGGRAGR